MNETTLTNHVTGSENNNPLTDSKSFLSASSNRSADILTQNIFRIQTINGTRNTRLHTLYSLYHPTNFHSLLFCTINCYLWFMVCSNYLSMHRNKRECGCI